MYAHFARKRRRKKKPATLKGHLLKGAAVGSGLSAVVTGKRIAKESYGIDRKLGHNKSFAAGNATRNAIKSGLIASIFNLKGIGASAAVGGGIYGAKKFRDRRKKKRRRSLR